MLGLRVGYIIAGFQTSSFFKNCACSSNATTQKLARNFAARALFNYLPFLPRRPGSPGGPCGPCGESPGNPFSPFTPRSPVDPSSKSSPGSPGGPGAPEGEDEILHYFDCLFCATVSVHFT